MYAALLIVLAVLAILFVSMAKVYRSVPLVELKRRARIGQQPAKSLYKVASYKYSSQFLLLLLGTVASAAFFVLLAKRSPTWVAVTGALALIWLAYIWVPRSSINIVSQYFAQIFAKPIGWVLQYIHPPLSRLQKFFDKPAHTGLYEREDIVRLLTLQQKQSDNRIDEFELDLLKHVVNFGSRRVTDVMTPKRKVQAIPANEILGPIVLSELHKTNHRYFPVYEDKSSNVVGILSLYGLSGSKLTVTAYEAMSQSIYYIHEEQNLNQALQVILKSGQEMLIVINNLGEYTGLITARAILKELVGETITDEFDQYDNRELVAKRFLAPEEKNNDLAEAPTEVIE